MRLKQDVVMTQTKTFKANHLACETLPNLPRQRRRLDLEEKDRGGIKDPLHDRICQFVYLFIYVFLAFKGMIIFSVLDICSLIFGFHFQPQIFIEVHPFSTTRCSYSWPPVT